MNIISMTDIDLQQHANIVLFQVVNSLIKEGFIDESKKDDILLNYHVIVVRGSWLPKFMQDFLKLGDNITYNLVKRIKT